MVTVWLRVYLRNHSDEEPRPHHRLRYMGLRRGLGVRGQRGLERGERTVDRHHGEPGVRFDKQMVHNRRFRRCLLHPYCRHGVSLSENIPNSTAPCHGNRRPAQHGADQAAIHSVAERNSNNDKVRKHDVEILLFT